MACLAAIVTDFFHFQMALSKTGIFDLADRIFATMHYNVSQRDSLLSIPKGIPKVRLEFAHA